MDASIIAIEAEPFVGRLQRQIMVVSDWPRRHEWTEQVKGHYPFTAPSLCHEGAVDPSGMALGFLPLSLHPSRDRASHAIGVLERLHHEVTIGETSLCPPDDVCRISFLDMEFGIKRCSQQIPAV